MGRSKDLADLAAVTSRLDTVGASSGALSHRNLIINGGMKVSQRGTSKTLVNGQKNFCTDRWHLYYAGFDNFAGTLTQDSDSPDGFSNSVKVTTTTAESAIASDEYAHLSQLVEAQNLQHLAYGTSAAKQLTLSFWVKSSITGTFVCGIYKNDNTAQIHNLTYTIDAANTWEKKTLTFAANTLSGGAIDNNNGIGFYVNWHLAAGSTYKGGGSTSGWSAYSSTKWADGLGTDAVMTTTNATFFLTGVQLEVGDTATDFEHRSYGDELARCQRYCVDLTPTSGTSPYLPGSAAAGNTTVAVCHLAFPVTMRATPSVTLSGTAGNYLIYNGGDRTVTGYAINGMSPQGGGINFTASGGGLTTNDACGVYANSTNVRSIIEAEL